MSPKRKKILLGVFALLVIIQFIPIDRSIPEIKAADDFLQIIHPPAEIKAQIENSCYDCHSYHTKYPWYSHIAPVSFLLKSHVKGGRQQMNFSEWGQLTKEEARHTLEDCVKILGKGWMPMKSYTNLHSEARLSEEQRASLIEWFKQVQ